MKKSYPTLHRVTEIARRKTIEQRLMEFDGNRKQTAESLNISRQQLQNLIRRYDIRIPPPVRYRSQRWFDDERI